MAIKETLEQTREFVKELPKIILNLDMELSKNQAKYTGDDGKYIEEGYLKEIGQIYKLKIIESKFGNLVQIYKELVRDNDEKIKIYKEKKLNEKEQLDLLEEIRKNERDKENIKKMLTLCNTGLILKIIGGLNIENEGGITKGELIAEGYQSLIDSLEKFEIDFTHEKSTKNTSIRLIEKQDDGILVEIRSNKPFATLDIKIKNLDEKTTEEFNQKIEWIEDGDMYSSKMLLEYGNLENDYFEAPESKIKLSVSKKVGHISTFLTNNIFFSQKNYLNKATPLKISNNYQILRNQILKIREKYDELFLREPSDRWIAYYLLTQNRTVIKLNKKETKAFEKYLINERKIQKLNDEETKIANEINFDNLDIFIKKYDDYSLVLTENQDTKRILMIKNKGVSDKNKNNFTNFGGATSNELIGNEDTVFYEKDFEKMIEKKLSEIEKIKYYQGVEQLDKEINDGEGTTLGDLIGDDSLVIEMINNLDNDYRKKEIETISEGILTPQEYYYFTLYFTNKIDFENFVIYKDGISNVKSILKRAFTKIMFYLQYKNLINN